MAHQDSSDDVSEVKDIEKNEDAGEPYQYDPNFNGIDEDRKCTDCCMTIFFILFICGMLALFFISLTRSNYKYLYIPTDTRGQMCGYDNTKIELNLDDYKFKDTDKKEWTKFNDLTEKPYLFWVRPGKHGYTRSFCVEKCPDAGLFFDTYRQLMPNNNLPDGTQNQTYGYTKGGKCGDAPNSTTATLENYSSTLPNRYFCPYQSFLFAKRCFPTSDSLISPDGKYNITQLSESITDALESLSSVSDAVQDLYLTWKWVAISIVIALALSLLYLLLLRVTAKVMVFVTVILVLAALGVLTYMCYKQSKNEFGNAGKMEGYSFGLYSQKLNKKVFTAFFWVLVAVDVIFVLLIIFLCNRILLSIGIIKCVSKIFGKVPQLFFFPIVVYILEFAWMAYVIGVAVVLFGAGTPYRIYDAENLIDKIQYKYDKIIQGFAIYHFIGFLWVLFFISALGQMTIAGVFADYYFAAEPRKTNMHKHPVSSSFFRALRYHTGSLATGSLIITIMTIIRLLLEYIDMKTKQSQSQVAQVIIKCMKCCFKCLDKFLKFLNRNCYIMIAIHGYTFWQGCKKAFELILRNVVRVTTLNFVGDFLLFLGRVFVCGAVTALSLYFFTKQVEGVTFPILPSLLVFVASFFASGAFTNVFEMGIDSTMLCFLEDEERNDGSPGHEKRAPEELQDFLQSK